jgi:hypothetical protein
VQLEMNADDPPMGLLFALPILSGSEGTLGPPPGAAGTG